MVKIEYDELQPKPYRVTFGYDPIIVEWIKTNINWLHRSWDANQKCWFFDSDGYDTWVDKSTFETDYNCKKPEKKEVKEIDVAKFMVAPYKPKQVQKEFIDLMIRKKMDGFGMFFSVGCGKTGGAILEFFRRRELGLCKRLLVIPCIAGLRFNWQTDIKKLFGLGCDIVDGNLSKRARAIRESESMIVITPFTTCRDRACVEAIVKENFFVVFDEVHKFSSFRIYEKGKQSIKEKNFTAIGGMSHIARGVKNRLILTGTPQKSNPLNAFISLHLIAPNVFSNKLNFDNTYGQFITTKFGEKLIGYKSLSTLREQLQFYGMFAKKEEYVDIPPKQEIDWTVEMSPQTKRLLEEQIEIIKSLGDTPDEIQLNAPYISIHRSIACPSAINPKYRSDKLDALKEILEQADEEDKVIVFTEFKDAVDEIVQEFSDMALKFDGRNKDKDWPIVLGEFERNKNKRMLVCTTDKMGAGYNIQCANIGIIYDSCLNGGDYEQTVGRMYREGQTKKVIVYNINLDIPFEKNRRKIIEQERELAAKLEGGEYIAKEVAKRSLKYIL